MERSQENATTHLNQNMNGTESFYQVPDHSVTNISLGLGSCITVINVTTMCFLLRHRKSIEGTGFWQQLVFLCFTDILTGIAIVSPPLGYLFFDVHADIYYSFCVFGVFLFPLSFTLSAGNCCIVSIYRYVILRYVDQPNTIWYKYASRWMILGNGIICLLTASSSVLVVSVLFGFQFKEFCDKVNMAGQNDYKSIYIMGTIVMLTLFLIVTNVFIILSIVKVRSMNRNQLADTTSTRSLNIIERNRYATVTFVAIVFALNLATVPTLLFVMVSLNERVSVSAETREIINRLFCMNSLLNPFIYSLRSTEFRIAVWTDTKAVISRVRCSHDAQ